MKHRISLETRLTLCIAIAALPGMAFWAWYLVHQREGLVSWLPWCALLIAIIMLMRYVQLSVLSMLRSISNVAESLRKGDYTIRVREDCTGTQEEMAAEINALAEELSSQHFQERESKLLLGKIMDEIELAVLALDVSGRLVLMNPAAVRLLGEATTIGQSVRRLGLGKLLDAEQAKPVVDLDLPGGRGRFSVRRRRFRMSGEAHILLVLADLSAPLRDEQQQAWQRLVRVLGHEINNSLAPIKSIAQTLVNLARRDGDSISQEDTIESLQLIASRADALGRFVAGYATLARLPEPMSQPMSLAALNQRVANLETRVPVATDGPEIDIMADPDQLEQALINLVRNAVDVTPPGGGVNIRWQEEAGGVLVEVLDRGPGPPDTDNLFVPFFTTKPGGSGIGLLLARRIAENHSGWLNLLSRDDGIAGAVARLWLPKVGAVAEAAKPPALDSAPNVQSA